VSDYPDNYSLRFGLANLYNNKGDIFRAIAEYENIYIHSKLNQG
jgi:kynureninase